MDDHFGLDICHGELVLLQSSEGVPKNNPIKRSVTRQNNVLGNVVSISAFSLCCGFFVHGKQYCMYELRPTQRPNIRPV